MRNNIIIWFIILILYVVAIAKPSWNRVNTSAVAKDYAAYHYAIQVAQESKNPYDTELLTQKARNEGKHKKNIRLGQWVKIDNNRYGRVKKLITEKEFHTKGIQVLLENGSVGRIVSPIFEHADPSRKIVPYFYPPPSLLGMLWAPHFGVTDGYILFFLLNNLCLFLSLFILYSWLKVPVWTIGLMCLTFTPIPYSNWMGQVNCIVLVFLLGSLWKRSGWLLSIAAMIKMSPAILLIPYGIWKDKKMVVSTVVGGCILSLLGLFVVNWQDQLYFYKEVLPQFSSGKYLDMFVNIDLDSNHSIPNLINRLFPHTDSSLENKILSPLAKNISTMITGISILFLGWFSKDTQDIGRKNCILGALISLMVVTPVYAYEHHLVFMIVPISIVIQAFVEKRIPKSWLPIAIFAYLILAWDWDHLRTGAYLMERQGQRVLASFMLEGKFFGCALIGMLCVLGAEKKRSNSK
jgi:uncharacterized protein YwbE